MATLSLRLDANEEKLFRNYAKLHNMTIDRQQNTQFRPPGQTLLASPGQFPAHR